MDSYRGLMAAVCAYTLWGILPVYWKLLQSFPALIILCHRMVWSLLVTLLLIFLSKRFGRLLKAVKSRNNLINYTTSALLLAANWFIFIWAVNANYILEASLGYYINPLINVVFGMIYFGEKLRVIQWLALFFAFLGVIYLTFFYGKFPWIAISLALTSGLYGLSHKKSKLPALDGLCLETVALFFPALLILLIVTFLGQEDSAVYSSLNLALLFGCGVITTVPLLLFGYAAHNIRFSTLGMLQYLAPTINLFLGIFVYFVRENHVLWAWSEFNGFAD